jgi:hypothetical protein
MDWGNLLNTAAGIALTLATVAMLVWVARHPERTRRTRRRQRL